MQNRFPLEPEARRNAPMDAASPRQTVETSALHNFIASYIPIPTCNQKIVQKQAWIEISTCNTRGRPKEKCNSKGLFCLEIIEEGGDSYPKKRIEEGRDHHTKDKRT